MKTITPPNSHDELGLVLRDILLSEIDGDEDEWNVFVLCRADDTKAVIRLAEEAPEVILCRA